MKNYKLVLATLTVLLISSPKAFSGFGNEGSGGGDGVMVDGEIIMRDLAKQGQLKIITNLVNFLDKNTAFRDLIHEIGIANPTFGEAIVKNLMNARIYTAPEGLNLLPYGNTTILGSAAEVQLAIRIGDDIILAPNFFESKTKEYIILHEALHGLLADNIGPFHHQRVRNIVSYIYENRENLDAEDFSAFLGKNNFTPNWNYNYVKASSFKWDLEADPLARCSVLNYSPELLKYENLKCTGHFMNEFLDKRSAGLREEFLKNDLYVKLVSKLSFKLQPNRLFDKNFNDYQRSSCTYAVGIIKNAATGNAELLRQLAVTKKLIEITDQMTKAEAYAIRNTFGYKLDIYSDSNYESTKFNIESALSIYNKNIDFSKSLVIECKKQFDNF